MSNTNAGQPPARDCRICGRAMAHVVVLPRTPQYPMQRFYRCAECPSVEMVEVPYLG